MRQAVGKETLFGLALALVGLLNSVLLPAYSKRRTTTQKAIAFEMLRSRTQPDRVVAPTNSRASQLHSSKQDQPNVTAVATVKIAFASDRDGNFEIYTMDVDGGGLTRLTENTAEDFSPAWSPDGSRLAFVSNRDGNNEIYLMNSDGTNQTRLTNNSADDLSPTWSPNGTKIAFTSRRDGHDQIYIMNPDGSGQSNLSNSPSDDTQPTFSPTGTLIGFASNRDTGRYQIYRMNSDGSSVTRLTNNTANDSNPNWSPGKITFQTERDDNEEIYAMNADGSSQTDISSNAAALDADPFRSGDGAKVAFSSTRSGDFEIFLANADFLRR